MVRNAHKKQFRSQNVGVNDERMWKNHRINVNIYRNLRKMRKNRVINAQIPIKKYNKKSDHFQTVFIKSSS